MSTGSSLGRLSTGGLNETTLGWFTCFFAFRTLAILHRVTERGGEREGERERERRGGGREGGREGGRKGRYVCR